MLDILRVAWRQSWYALVSSGDFWLGLGAGVVVTFAALVLLHRHWERQGWTLTHPD